MNDLLIPLKEDSRFPMYRQIYDHIKNEIQKGKMKAGEKLPSSRLLAKNLCISRSTVDMAYDQLSAEGYIEAVPCKGYYVCQMEGLYFSTEKKFFPEKNPGREIPAPAYRWDFALNGIAPGGFPQNTWRKLSREVLSQEGDSLFQLGDPCGEPGIRLAVAEYLHSARGVDCDPDQIIIGAGNDYLLMLLWVILGKNRKIAMENPTYLSAYYDLVHMGCQIIPVGQDSQGICIEDLEKNGADTVYVMPSHQFPMGMVMPLKRRMELLKWAQDQEKRYIIEDDYDSEFRYKGQPIPALAGFDQKGCVIYLGTFSKSLAPSVRVSYMVLPPVLMKAYLSLGHLFSVTVSRTDQKILELFLREGYYERHLNRMRAVYKNKHDLMVRYLKEMSHICTFSGENAGVHLVVRFCNGLTEKEGIRRAKEAGIKVYGVSEYRIRQVEKEENKVLLGYATMEEKDIEEAMKKLKEIWKI